MTHGTTENIFTLYTEYIFVHCTHFFYSLFIYLFLMYYMCKRLTSTMFEAVHSWSTLLVLLSKHVVPDITFSNSICNITTCNYDNMDECNITTYVNNSLSFSSRLVKFKFYLLIFLSTNFIWIAKGDGDLSSSLICYQNQCSWKRISIRPVIKSET